MSADFSQWVVLSRPECSLCDEFIADLADLIGAAAAGIRVLDVSDDAALEGRYGQRIPVLLIDGDFVCGHRLDVARVRGYLNN